MSNPCVPVPIVAFGIHICPQVLVFSLRATFYSCSGTGTNQWLTVIHLVHTYRAIRLV